jgi:hypothetical protein
MMNKAEPVTTFTGVGYVFEKDMHLARVIYYLVVERTFENIQRFRGSMTVYRKTMAFQPDTVYTLRLEDGRKLDFHAEGVVLADYNIQIHPIGDLY